MNTCLQSKVPYCSKNPRVICLSFIHWVPMIWNAMLLFLSLSSFPMDQNILQMTDFSLDASDISQYSITLCDSFPRMSPLVLTTTWR